MKSIFFGLLLVAMVMASLSDSSVKKTQNDKTRKKVSWRPRIVKLVRRIVKATKRIIEHVKRSRRRVAIPPKLCPGGSPYPQTRCPRPGPTRRPYIDPEIINKGSTNDEEIQYPDQDGADTGESVDEDVFDFLEAMDQIDQQN
ncbi:uncharacterized protein LOC144420819 [Styela clava]